MMRRLYIALIISCCFLQTAFSQSVGTWKTYLAYYKTTAIAEGNNYVFAVANGSLYSYGDDTSIKYFSKQTGLSDNEITSIAFNSNQNTLVITYSNGNIDLLGDKGIKNVSFLKESSIPNKRVNNIYNYNEFAYLCTEFGIVVLDIKKQEIKETYRLNKPVLSALIHNNNIYAIADSTLLSATINENLIDPGNWNQYKTNNTEVDNNKVTRVCFFQNALCILVNKKGIYYQSTNGFQFLLNSSSFTNMKIENEKLITFSNNGQYIYSSFNQVDRINIGAQDVSSLKDKNIFWFAAGDQGLIGLKRTGSNQYETIANIQNTDMPKNNYNDFLMMYNDKLYIAGGGRWTDRHGREGTVIIYDPEEQKWNNFKSVSGFRDATSIAVDPENENHLFVSTWGEGIYEFDNNELVKIYNRSNSPLETSNPDYYPENYIRVEGLCYDKNNNLWMTNTAITNATIKVLKADGTWTSFIYPDIQNPNLADKILIRNNGDKWINVVRGNNAGLFVFNDNGTIDDKSDDKHRHFRSLSDANTNIGTNYYFCLTEDKNNDLWIGTDRGPIILYNPSRVLDNPDSNVSFNRIVRTDDDGNLMYFLGDERVNAIAVDGGNRKWIGTASSGVFLVSEDGKETLEQFTTDNSYLLSNNIQSIAIDNNTGEVFIGTDKGLVSYFGEATKGSESYSDVYAYPNPVRPDFDEKVIITGLMENSNIKITDVRGNLIFQTKSVGGQVSWNCRNKSGKRVASGVYLVLAATPEAKESVVTKIAVVQ